MFEIHGFVIPLRSGVLLAAVLCLGTTAIAQEKPSSVTTVSPKPVATDRFGSQPILTPAQWDKLDSSVDRALAFIARRQSTDGSFPTDASGQPAVTALCVMAFLSRGHMPNEGQYGKQISRAIDYVLDVQKADGTLALRGVEQRGASFEGNYNHAIAGLMLGEIYGMTQSEQHERVHTAIENALRLTRQQQLMPKRTPAEKGGWRYMRRYGVTDADLSVTAWELMFLRSARNAEFEVPQEWIEEGMGCVRRLYDPAEKAFLYGLRGEDRYSSRGMVGAGIVSLSLGGEHNSDMAKDAGNWILKHTFDQYNRARHPEDRYHYSAFYCSQAMFQLGGEYWFQFFPNLLDVIADNQNKDGSWDAESNGNDFKYGNVYSSALTVLTLTPPYQLLPIYQR